MEASSVVFRNGDEGYPFYRIPTLLRVNATLLLAFAEGRHQRQDHGRVDIVQKRSTDGGNTWSPLALVQSVGSGTIGNPTPLYDEPEVVLFFCRDNLAIHITRSLDGGISWTHAEPIGWTRPPEWKWLASGPPAAMRMRTGRWVLPCDGLIGSTQIYKATSVFSFILYSDDRGGTWQSGPLLEGGNECQAAELSNGSLALNMRSRDLVRLHAISHDGGAHWDAPWRAVPPVADGNVQGSMIGLQDGRMLLATNAGAGRRRLTARTSRDGGARWQTHSVLESGLAAYSALVDLSGGWVGCLYETHREREHMQPTAPPIAARARRAVVSEANVLRYLRFCALDECPDEIAAQPDQGPASSCAASPSPAIPSG